MGIYFKAMLLRLIVIEGPRQGEEIILRDAIIIGRKGGDLNLLDSKVSGQHAKIFDNADGIATIEDLGSSNGTYVNDVKVTSQGLKVGDRITIGRTVFKVEEGLSNQEVGLGRGTWQDIAEEAFSETLKNLDKKQPTPVKWGPYNFPVRLDFIKGLQAGTSITMGFGPRKLGKLCPDGLLLDPNAPDIAFELFPSQVGLCELRSSFKDLKINERKWPEEAAKEIREKIRNGDRISFGQTVIVVKALKQI
jgi:pSer/pThr/pTyr-binding forkhead associated (FHA) protein